MSKNIFKIGIFEIKYYFSVFRTVLGDKMSSPGPDTHDLFYSTFWTLNNLVCSTCGKKLTTVAGLRYFVNTDDTGFNIKPFKI